MFSKELILLFSILCLTFICEASSGEIIPSVFHQRNKRFIVFEKGTMLTITVSIAKSIISGIPRGFNIVNEITIYYDLPYTIDMVFGKFLHHRRKTTTSTTTTTTMKPYIPWLHNESVVNLDYMNSVDYKWHRFDRFPQSCPQRDVFNRNNAWNSKWCESNSRMALPSYYRRFDKRSTSDENMFYDIIDQLTRIHDYNGRHCAMRTLCEAQHLLLPAGQSLFHDILRILIKFAKPRLQQDIKMQRALQHAGLEECATLYGPHCRLSFLKHFTQAIHGNLM